MNKKVRPLIRAAKEHGARIVTSGKHVKIYDGPRLVAVLSHGRGGFEGPADNKIIEKRFKELGWM